MIDDVDEVLNNGQSSPPPPAPNGEHTNDMFPHPMSMQQQRQIQDASWNPFYTPAIQQKEPQLSSMNPFHADLMKQQVNTMKEKLAIESKKN